MSQYENDYERFHTPSDDIAAREVAAMSDEERARAMSAGIVHVETGSPFWRCRSYSGL